MFRLVLAFALVSFVAASVAAQTAALSGTVIDPSGGALPGADIQLTGPVGQLTTSGPRGDYTFRSLPAGTFQLTVKLSGFATSVRSVTVGPGDIEMAPITLALATLNDVVVVTATKAESALLDAPVTMSVISSETLASTPATNYADLLRSVPGLNAVQTSARDFNLTCRQSTSTLSNSQLVLIDGRSVYLDFFGLVLWDFLPTNFGDIKQIEVVRGPASAVWGANALTGVVNIITKSPREAPGTTVTLSGGFFGRDTGAGGDDDPGATFGASVRTAHILNDRWAYRASAGYFTSDPLPRPTGRIPLITDPRDPGAVVGGAPYPIDGEGAPGAAFVNQGTRQPKVDVQFDQEIARGRMTYAAGVVGSEGIIHTGIGPFAIQRGSVNGYAKVGYRRDALKVGFFTNLIDADAPNLLLADPSTNRPIQLNFKTQTYDFEVGDSRHLGLRQLFTYGGNVRRNNFSISIAPAAENRTELGAYVQDEIFVDRFRFTVGGRVDKFGNLSDPVFSPRLAAVYKVTPAHALRGSFNRAFRSPSVINNYLDTHIVVPTDLSGLAPLLPPALRPLVAAPFPLDVRAVGSRIPIGGTAQEELREESVTAYEVAYTGTFGGRTTAGAAFYVNDVDDNINFAQLPNTRDPYTAANPPPGWLLGGDILALLAQRGIVLPRTAYTYLNLGPLRQKGIELSIDHRLTTGLSVFANYSWQARPAVIDDPQPFPTQELALPPTNRVNVGLAYDGRRLLGSGTVNYSDRAFWSDVLSGPYHGFTDAYTMVNGSVGVKWANGRITTLARATNLLDRKIQQHVFGDVITRSVIGEVRVTLP